MRPLLVVLVIVLAAMAGCITKKDDGKDATTSTSTTGTGSRSATSTTGGPGSTATPLRTATLSANATNGTAPLAVAFTLNASAGATSWRLAFGDGAVANGTGQPSSANHTYAVGGDFSANLTVVFPNGNATANLTITVAVPAARAAPDVTHFEFGSSLGCVGDLGADSCISFNAGPDGSGIDGWWQALDERYWGLHLTSTIDSDAPLADSDCAFVDADETTIIGDADNSSNPCDGVVPAGTAWLYIYPYATPANGLTVDFATA